MSQSIYELLTGVKIEEATVEQLDSATGRTFVDRQSIEFWQGILTLSHVMKAARTYPYGLPIPETGAIEVVTIADSAVGVIKPQGDTEVWRVENIDVDNCNASFFDGTTASPITADGSGNLINNPPFYISAKCYLAFSNGSGSEQTPSIAYHKVSL